MRVRAAIVIPHFDGNGGLRPRYLKHASVIVTVVNHHDGIGRRILPDKHVGHIRRSARRVDANIEKPHSHRLQGSDNPA